MANAIQTPVGNVYCSLLADRSSNDWCGAGPSLSLCALTDCGHLVAVMPFNFPVSPTMTSSSASAARSFSHNHHRHSSLSAASSHLSPALHVPSSNTSSQHPRERRVWVKRPGGTATTIIVHDDDLVDDLKTYIIRKYPTSLGRTCDPADINIKQMPSNDHSSNNNTTTTTTTTNNNNNNSSSSKHYNLASSPKRVALAPIVLEPDQTVFKVLDQYFPSGMTMADAWVIDFAQHQRESSSDDKIYVDPPAGPSLRSPPQAQSHVRSQSHDHHLSQPTPRPPLHSQRSLSEDHSADVSRPGVPEPQQSHSRAHSASPGQPSPVPPSQVAHRQINTVKEATPSPTSATSPVSATSKLPMINSNPGSRVTSPSATGGNSFKSSPNNGVLLLPRQFQMPKSQHDSHQTSRKQSTDGSINVNDEESSRETSQSRESDKTARRASDSNGTIGTTRANDASEVNGANGTAAKQPSKDRSARAQGPKPTINSSTAVALNKPLNLKMPILEGVVPQVNVLIVEDNLINQKILEAFMRRKKIRCSVAKNGKEAVDKWRQGGFHLVLMDIQLPVMSGIEATKEIRRLEHMNRIGVFSSSDVKQNVAAEDQLDTRLFRSPVIVVALTASSSSADKSEALAAGCNDFLTKPVNLLWLEQKTIEWGCMQALIDFEGWKHWAGRDNNAPPLGRSRSRSRPRSKSKRGSLPPLTGITSTTTPTTTTTSTPAVPRPEVAESVKVWQGPQGVKIKTLRYGSRGDKQALVQITGADHNWDGKILLANVEHKGARNDYSVEVDGKEFVVLILYQQHNRGELYLPGESGHRYISYSHDLSTQDNAQSFLAEYLKQPSEYEPRAR
uniref:ARAD1C01430p n=1 Tax=Blastobotrys adeninivorans TaxID=409370 RepID=A0A060SYI3_BLAAD